MAQRVRVPQFGKWDDGNAAYTMIFENARKDKNTEIVNPNDPEAMAAAVAANDRPLAPGAPARAQNPQAFRAKEQRQDRMPPANYQQPPNMDHSGSQTRQRQQGPPGRRAPEPAGNYGLAPASPLPAGRKVAVPKFGGWNEAGAPTEGYTIVFNKVKEEKQQIVHGVPTPSRNDPATYQAGRTYGDKPAESFWTKLLRCFNPSAN